MEGLTYLQGQFSQAGYLGCIRLFGHHEPAAATDQPWSGLVWLSMPLVDLDAACPSRIIIHGLSASCVKFLQPSPVRLRGSSKGRRLRPGGHRAYLRVEQANRMARRLLATCGKPRLPW